MLYVPKFMLQLLEFLRISALFCKEATLLACMYNYKWVASFFESENTFLVVIQKKVECLWYRLWQVVFFAVRKNGICLCQGRQALG
jgi:hypothetical protein